MAINRDKPVTAKPTTKAEIPASPPVTFSLEKMQEIVAAAVAKATAETKAAVLAEMKAAKTPTEWANGKSEISAKNDLAVLRACKKAGFKDVQPRVNVLTFRKWVEKGYRPKEGSSALKINNLRLWHVSQVRPMSKDEIAAMKVQSEASDQRRSKAAKGKVVPIHGQAEMPV